MTKAPTISTDTALLAARDFLAAVDTRASRTDGPITLDAELTELAAAWERDGLAVTDDIQQAVDGYIRFWARAIKQWGGSGRPSDTVMAGDRRAIAGAVHAAIAQYERTQAPTAEVAAAAQRVAGIEAELAAAVSALDVAVQTGDLPESLRLRGPARVELPAALAETRLQLLDAQLEQLRRGGELSRVRVERAAAAIQAADQAIVAAEQQVRAAIDTARLRRQQAQEAHALDEHHRMPIEALRAERERLLAAQAEEQGRRQQELAALTA